MVSNPFVLDKPHGNFRDFKGKYAFNSLMAEQVTELALAHSEKEAKNARKAIVMMKEKGSTIDEANREAIKRHCHNALRRTPTEEEMEVMMGLLKKVDSELGVPFGLQAVYASIILKFETLFRFEGMGASDDDTGLVALSALNWPPLLAFALTDLAPDGNLLKAFRTKICLHAEILRTEIRRMLDDENRPTARNRLLQFFQEYFDYQKAEDVFKDQIKGHRHWGARLGVRSRSIGRAGAERGQASSQDPAHHARIPSPRQQPQGPWQSLGLQFASRLETEPQAI